MKHIVLTRRSFVKAAAIVGASASVGGMLGACASSESTQSASGANQGEETGASAEESSSEAAQTPQTSQSEASQAAGNEAQSGAADSSDAAANEAAQANEATPSAGAAGSILVAYFSATGHTQAIAESIAADLGADTFVITPAQPYSSEDLGYNNDNSRVSTEHEDPNRHVELAQITPDNFAKYDTVFVGYPTWWGGASWVMDDFVTGNNFTGKTVVPFTTSASSPLGTSASNLAALCGTGDWREGERFSIGAAATAVSQWLREMGY